MGEGGAVDSERVIDAAAIFSRHDKLDWDEKRRSAFAQAKRREETMPDEVVHQTKEWRARQVKLLEKQRARISALPARQRQLVDTTADLLSMLVVHLHLREAMLYPLVRDQLPMGEELFRRGVERNEAVRHELRAVRMTLAYDLMSRSWIYHLDKAQELWSDGWDQEQRGMLAELVAWLRSAPVPTMKEISPSKDHPMADTSPPADHDLNYGQQLVQMWSILRAHHRRSGLFQGIPKPRHEPDWSCQDGFHALPPQCHGCASAPGWSVRTPPEPEEHGLPRSRLHRGDEAAGVAYAPRFGESAGVLRTRPDAQVKEERERMEQMQVQAQELNQQAIEEAHKAHYGPMLVERWQKMLNTIANSTDKAKSFVEWLNSDLHTTDIEGSFNKAEVNLAFRNHGTHFEALSVPITPLGAHYLLIHFDVQRFDPVEDSYRLLVHGCVERPLELTLDQVKKMCPEAVVRQPMVMECSGNGRSLMKPRFNHHVPWALQAFGCYVWTGMPLRVLLEAAGVDRSKAVDVVFTGYDAGFHEDNLGHYQRAVEILDPVLDLMMICWQNNGTDLLPEHGYPIRVLTPGWYGDNNVKWLRSIEVVDHKFRGQNMVSYSYTKQNHDRDIAVPSQEIRPRAMMRPMGFPSFMTRQRTLTAGKHTWMGRAWVGGGFYRTVMAVEVSLDNGQTWVRAKLEPRLGMFAWHRFTLDVCLEVGIYIKVRATDSTGHQQKVELGEEDWSFHGMCDDACQTIFLTVVDKLAFTT